MKTEQTKYSNIFFGVTVLVKIFLVTWNSSQKEN